MIAAVVFDAPLAHAYRYVVPDEWRVVPGQRVRAPLGRDVRVGLVVEVHNEPATGLKRLESVVDPSPVVDRAGLDLIAWIAARSLSSVGSTAAGLLPPPLDVEDIGETRADTAVGADPALSSDDTMAGVISNPVDQRAAGITADLEVDSSDHTALAGLAVDERAPFEATAAAGQPLPRPADRPPLANVAPGDAATLTSRGRAAGAAPRVQDRVAGSAAPSGPRPELYIGTGRERRLLADVAGWRGGVLVIVPDVTAAARWTERLAALGPVARLDSGAGTPRGTAWRALGAGTARLAVGTRSALLAPVSRPALLVLIDEHEAAHQPPGYPRMHAREVLLERAAREDARLVLTAATPSVEMWSRAASGRAGCVPGSSVAWPTVILADTRGTLRREPLAPELSRALRETLGAGARAFLGVSRLASALACDECGDLLRCAACGLALTYARAGGILTCRLCHASQPSPETCPTCGGRRLSPFGWGAERVEHAVRRRFPRARVSRYDPEARGTRAHAQRATAATADVVIGTRGALRLFGRATLGLAGFVNPDQLLRVPDFRAGERTLGLLWAAAERVRPGGTLVIQSQHVAHPAYAAVAAQDLERFYEPELVFRDELGYPPFRRLAVITLRPQRAGAASLATGGAGTVADALQAIPGLVVYPPVQRGRERALRVVVKGGDDLADVLAKALGPVGSGRAATRASRGIMDVEVDPVEWPF